MNADFEDIKAILLQIKSDYMSDFANNNIKAGIHITERDIVSEIYNRLKIYCKSKRLFTHTEIKPISNIELKTSELKRLPRIDNVILKNIGDESCISEAINLQNNYKKGSIEARFSSIRIKFFHTAIEVKIQSKIIDAKKDIDKLRAIQDFNKDCNCFFMLLNARGRVSDHNRILEYAKMRDITVIEFTNNIQYQFKENSMGLLNNNIEPASNVTLLPRRRRIIDLINKELSDTEILKILDNEYPIGTFKTKNCAALYGTKRDLGLKYAHK